MSKLAILLATYNGMPWIKEQLSSIVQQDGADIDIWVSDDMSIDGTWEWLQDAALNNRKIFLLPREKKLGSAGKNFYHLLQSVNVTSYDYIAYADQDDIWLPKKIQKSLQAMKHLKCDGISSNITAFWPDGKKRSIIKNYRQKKYDFFFESAGPGCSYIIDRHLALDIVSLISDISICAADVELHDWLTYAICRLTRRKWHILNESLMLYRQHSNNAIGANSGLSGMIARHNMINSGWYREEVLKLLQVADKICSDREGFDRLVAAIEHGETKDKLYCLLNMSQFRRSPIDCAKLGGYFLTGLFWGK